jgi:alpha-glucuronidase
MAGAGGDWIRGPWECQCPRCREHGDRALLVEAMRMIGERWAEAGGRIIWKAVTDRPTLVGTEVEHFADLDDVLPPYVRIAHKAFYKDFRPPHPLHPLFYAHAEQRERVRPYLCEFQIYGEYRGADDFPCVMIDRWGQIAPRVARLGYGGLMGICSMGGVEDWDHPLNMANWYAFGRYAWNPEELPDVIWRDWATGTFGADAADAVIEIGRLSYQASMKMMFFRGVMTQNHSKLPTIDYELESSLVGPWHDIPRSPDGFMGREHDVSMYPPAVVEEIRNDPGLRLWAHRVPITPAVCDEAIAEKREAWELVRLMAAKWAALPHDGWDALHRDVSERFGRNLVDAELWYEAHRLYFDYKAGRLTRGDLTRRLADIKARFDPERGTGLIRHTFARFLEEWQRVLDGNLTRRSMEGMYHNPGGEPFLPGLKAE